MRGCVIGFQGSEGMEEERKMYICLIFPTQVMSECGWEWILIVLCILVWVEVWVRCLVLSLKNSFIRILFLSIHYSLLSLLFLFKIYFLSFLIFFFQNVVSLLSLNLILLFDSIQNLYGRYLLFCVEEYKGMKKKERKWSKDDERKQWGRCCCRLRRDGHRKRATDKQTMRRFSFYFLWYWRERRVKWNDRHVSLWGWRDRKYWEREKMKKLWGDDGRLMRMREFSYWISLLFFS